jgi:ribosomal protein S18 acetylase RimI-like enzyme
MINLFYRELEKKYYSKIKQLISSAFQVHRFAEKKHIVNSALEIYIRHCLIESSYSKVAILNGELVGVILGRAEHQPKLSQRWLHQVVGIFHQAKIALTALGDLKKILEYYQLSRAYAKLKARCPKTFSGEVTLLIVSDQCRGHGVGKKLFTDFKHYLQKHNASSFYLYTDSSLSFGFYDRQGMVRECTENITLNIEATPYKLAVYLYSGEVSTESETKSCS